MQCKKYQDMILTDYLDNELDSARKKEILTHLSRCESCRHFEQIARRAALEPFENTKPLIPPSRIWDSIEVELDKEQNSATDNIFSRIVKNIRIYTAALRPVFVIAVLFGAVLLVMNPVPRQGSKNNVAVTADEENIEYLAALFNGSQSAASEEDSGYGTSIEEYFL